MKKSIIALLLTVLILSSCGESKEEKQVEEIVDKVADLQDEAMNLAQKVDSGEMSEEEYDEKINDLEDEASELDKKIDASLEKLSEDDFPSWAKKEGLEKISGLTFEELQGEIVKKDSEAGFDAINIIYSGEDYDVVIEKAEALAKKMNIEELDISPRKTMVGMGDMFAGMGLSEEQMQQMQLDMGDTSKGAIFANCVLGMTCSDEYEYAKLISVEENGEKWEINISIVDIKGWTENAEKYVEQYDDIMEDF